MLSVPTRTQALGDSGADWPNAFLTLIRFPKTTPIPVAVLDTRKARREMLRKAMPSNAFFIRAPSGLPGGLDGGHALGISVATADGGLAVIYDLRRRGRPVLLPQGP